MALHASVVVAVTAGAQRATNLEDRAAPVAIEDPGLTIDIGESEAIPPPPPKEREPVVVPESRAPAPSVAVNLSSTATRAETFPPLAKVFPAKSEEKSEGDLAPDVVAVHAESRARFVMALGTGTTVTAGLAKSSGSGQDETDTYAESGVSSRARLLEGTPPEYPLAARAAAVEADLPLEIVVDATGKVVDARLLKHAGFGLDEAALRAVRAYRFIPAQRAGHGVSVRMHWVVDFRLD